MPLDDLIESQKSALTVSEVAEMLHVSRRLIYQLVTIGEIPNFKVGSAVRFEPHRLAEWLRAKLKQGGKEDELAKIHRAHSVAYEPVGDMTAWGTKQWGEVLLPVGKMKCYFWFWAKVFFDRDCEDRRQAWRMMGAELRDHTRLGVWISDRLMDYRLNRQGK